MKEKINDFWRNLKIFMAYILTRPFVELWNMFKLFYTGSSNLEKPYFWVRFFGMLTIFLIIVGLTTKYLIPAYIAAAVTLIALLRFEWISGRYRKWHLDNIKKKAKRQLEGKTNG